MKKLILICLLFTVAACTKTPTQPRLPAAVPFDSFNTATTTEITETSKDEDAFDLEKPPASEEVPTAKLDELPDVADTAPSIAPINLAIPFQPQAPYADWSEPYKEGCEEASLIMVDYYLRGVTLSREEMKNGIDAQVAWQMKNNGGHFDLSIAQVAQMAEVLYPDYSVTIIPKLTKSAIAHELQNGRPVIVPTAGRELKNPFFKQPGPLYHMLVIKGVTSDGKYITNDPGTKRGADYVYDSDTLMSAIRDWDGDSPDGATTGMVLYK